MTSLTPILLMVLPSFWVRCAVLHPHSPFSSRKKALYFGLPLLFLGMALDLFVFSQLLLVYWMISFIFVPKIAGFIFIGLVTLVQGVIIFDAFLLKKTGIRMEVGYLRLAKDIRCFWDSGKERGFFLFFPIAALTFILQGSAFALTPPLTFHLGYALTFVALFGVAVFSMWLLPKRMQYHFLPIVLYHQQWFAKKLSNRFDKEEQCFQNKRVFGSLNEESSLLSESYPLLKLTKKFTGEKEFNLKCDDRPNVILLFLESFRAKDIGAYGSGKGLTPHFDRLANEGILFKNFYSNSVKTSRCVTASLFGMPSDTDGSGVSNRVDSPFISIAELMGQAGYYSTYLHNGALKFENQRTFFRRHGYRTVLGRDEITKFCPGAPGISWGVHDEYLMRYGLHWIDKVSPKNQPFFMTIFTISNHHPWRLPHEDNPLPLTNETAYARYQKTFTYTDQAVNMLVEGVKSLGLEKKTIFFILGDHGHAMGEHHQNFNQQMNLYNEQIHVPFLIYAPGRIEAPQVITTPSSQLDLLPTFMDLFQIEGLNHSIGSSLVRKRENPTVYFHNPYMHNYLGARKGRYKCIYLKNIQEVLLFDLETDPEERKNIADDHPYIVAELLRDLIDYEKGMQRCYDRRCVAPHPYEIDDLSFNC